METLEKEGKFLISCYDVDRVTHWLKHTCAPDPSFAFGVVSSIYYDTRDWDFLREKVNSDYLKTKVRLRWYGSSVDSPAEGAAFAEVKYRIGSLRDKIRVKTHYSAEWLSGVGLENSDLLRVPLLIQAHGFRLHKPVFPAFVVSYCRQRFVERLSGARVCLDYAISAPRVNRQTLPRALPAKLSVAVFEVKSSDGEMPTVLRRLVALGCKKDSFSKYLACYQKLTRLVF